MIREWKNYHNTQKYNECQLITAINAYHFLTGKIIKSDSKRYESLVDLCGARHGAAICIEKVHKKLNLKIKNYMISPFSWRKDKKGFSEKIKNIKLPLEISVWHKSCGYHSALIIEYEPRTDAFRVANFKGVTNSQGWVFQEDLQHYLKVNVGNRIRQSCPKCDKQELKWQYRLFTLEKNSNV